MPKQAKYRRVLLKISGEALAADESAQTINPAMLDYLAAEIKAARDLGVEVAIVIGGGNLFRGATLSQAGLKRTDGDYMGMLATLMNAVALRSALEHAGFTSLIYSPQAIKGVSHVFDQRDAIHNLEEGRVLIFAGGTGNPLVTTDSAASLRGVEIEADLIIKATQVDGVYTADPLVDPNARRYTQLTYTEALQKELAVMDLAAFLQCRDYNLRLAVFNVHQAGGLVRIICGEPEGTIVENEHD